MPRAGRLLAHLERARRERGDQRGVEAILRALARACFTDAERLAEFHDALLYFFAHPARSVVRRVAERILAGFAVRVAALGARSGMRGADLSALEGTAHSGIAGTSVTTTFSFDLLRSVCRAAGQSLTVARDLGEANPDRLAATLPRILPLLEEESLVDANVPYGAWLDASGNDGTASSLLARFHELPVSCADRAELFDALALPVTWNLGRSSWSRTALRLPARRLFFHGHRLLARRDVDLSSEISGRRMPVRKLSAAEGSRALDAARAALATRYREFYTFNHGDPATAIEADAGRGVRIYVFGLPPARRLPLRAGAGTLIVRNGVPIGYGDGFVLFERVDLSFNVFPEYRDGESAFVFARLVRLYRQIFGATVVSIDPYQIGFENEEAIGSGAFWFYRRLGFRSVSPRIESLARREDERVAADRRYRSSRRVLRRLAAAAMTYGPATDAWDRFRIRNIGFAVERRMAETGDSAEHFRGRSGARVARILSVSPSRMDPVRLRRFSDWALVLDRIPDLPRWSAEDIDAIGAIVEAKSGRTEVRYLRLMQRHAGLRNRLLKLGSDRRF